MYKLLLYKRSILITKFVIKIILKNIESRERDN